MNRPATPEEQLRNAGLRVTQARIGVVETLHALGGHPTADDVARGLEARDIAASRATVFNVLDDLTRVGLTMIVDAGAGATRYEPAATWHHHFVCGVCGGISDVACVDDTEPCITPSEAPGVVDGVQVIFRGTCNDCLTQRA